MQTNIFWLNFGGLSLAVTFKIRSRSPKPIQLVIMSKCYIPANLVKIHQQVHEILCSLRPAVTLKNRSRSPKPNQLFNMSQCYIHANLVEICQPVHEIWCKQESVTPTPTLTPTGSYVPLPFGGGHNHHNFRTVQDSLMKYHRYVPIINLLNGQTTQRNKRASVFILAYDTRFDRLSYPVKFHEVILYGSKVIALFTN